MDDYGGWQFSQVIGPTAKYPIITQTTLSGKEKQIVNPGAFAGMNDQQLLQIYHSALTKARYDPTLTGEIRKHYRKIAAGARKAMSSEGKMAFRRSAYSFGNYGNLYRNVGVSNFHRMPTLKKRGEKMNRWINLVRYPYHDTAAEALIRGYDPSVFGDKQMGDILTHIPPILTGTAQEYNKAMFDERNSPEAIARRNKRKQSMMQQLGPNYTAEDLANYRAIRKLPYHGRFVGAVDTDDYDQLYKQKWEGQVVPPIGNHPNFHF